MKKLICTAIVFLLLISASSGVLGATKEPSYSSEKPLYGFVVLDEKATKVLKIVFDESEGTGKGYDTIYADVNLNGDLSDEKAVKGTLRKSRSLVNCRFPAIGAAVPYNEKAKGIKEPWQLTISCYQFQREERTDPPRFSLEAKMRLKDESGEWEYSFPGPLYPAEKPQGMLALAFAGKPFLTLHAMPDQEKEGKTGIAAYLIAEALPISCNRDGKPVMAEVRIRNKQGKTVLSEDVSSDKLTFG